jgi:hypothetical protein
VGYRTTWREYLAIFRNRQAKRLLSHRPAFEEIEVTGQATPTRHNPAGSKIIARLRQMSISDAGVISALVSELGMSNAEAAAALQEYRSGGKNGEMSES